MNKIFLLSIAILMIPFFIKADQTTNEVRAISMISTGTCVDIVVDTSHIMYSNYCIDCDARASYIFNGNSYCKKHFIYHKFKVKNEVKP